MIENCVTCLCQGRLVAAVVWFGSSMPYSEGISLCAEHEPIEGDPWDFMRRLIVDVERLTAGITGLRAELAESALAQIKLTDESAALIREVERLTADLRNLTAELRDAEEYTAMLEDAAE